MKIFTLILFFLFTLNTHAQTNAPDITMTDIHGVSRNLYTELDAGKQVILEFFMTTCGTCQINTAPLENFWINYGYNGDSLWVWSIEVNRASDSVIEAFYNLYPATFPSFSTETDTLVISDYNVTYTPQYISICPNRVMKHVVIESIENNDVACPELTSISITNNAKENIYYSNENRILYLNFPLENTLNEFIIFSQMGEEMGRYFTTNKEMNIEMSDYENGLYIVVGSSKNEKTFSRRFVIIN